MTLVRIGLACLASGTLLVVELAGHQPRVPVPVLTLAFFTSVVTMAVTWRLSSRIHAATFAGLLFGQFALVRSLVRFHWIDGLEWSSSIFRSLERAAVAAALAWLLFFTAEAFSKLAKDRMVKKDLKP